MIGTVSPTPIDNLLYVPAERGVCVCVLLLQVLNPLTGESDGVGNVFVACKSARQAAEKLPAQATTVSLRSREPVWNKLLTVRVDGGGRDCSAVMLVQTLSGIRWLLIRAHLLDRGFNFVIVGDGLASARR